MVNHLPEESFRHTLQYDGIPMPLIHVVTGLNLWISGAPSNGLVRIGFQVHSVGRIQVEQTEYFAMQAKRDYIVSKWHIFRCHW